MEPTSGCIAINCPTRRARSSFNLLHLLPIARVFLSRPVQGIRQVGRIRPFLSLAGAIRSSSRCSLSEGGISRRVARKMRSRLAPRTHRGAAPPVLLERIEVSGFSIDGSSSSNRFDDWWARMSDPRPVLSASDMRTLFDQWYLEQNRSEWEQWRQRQCASVHSYAAASAVATGALAASCTFVWTPVGAVGCAVSAVGLILAMSQQASATAACLGPYPGPGGWP